MSIETKDKAQEFVDTADEGCKQCKNFGNSACPSFKQAVEELDIDADELSDAISEEQKGQTLIPCKNVPS